MDLYNAIKKYNQWRKLKVKDINGSNGDLLNFAMYMRNCRVVEIELDDVLGYLNYYPTFGYSRSTLIKKEENIKKFFEFYRRQGYDVIDPWLIPISKPQFTMPRICSEENYRRLIAAIPLDTDAYYNIRNLCLINMCWETGARINEVCSLNVSDLDFKEKEVVIKTEKSRGVYPFRKLPWGKDTENSLPKWIKRRNHIALDYDLPEPDALFIGLKSSGGSRLTRASAEEIFRKYSNKAGIPPESATNPHSMRHAFGHRLAKKHNNSVISAALGHSSLGSSYRYTMLNGNELVKELKRKNK
jgi:integrase/recombinase XerD